MQGDPLIDDEAGELIAAAVLAVGVLIDREQHVQLAVSSSSTMARAILRYSASTGPDGNQMRDGIRDALRGARFEKVGTACWEVRDTSLAGIGLAIEQVAKVIRGSAPDTLDHLWVYVDNPTDD